jgi:hypothetical protein
LINQIASLPDVVFSITKVAPEEQKYIIHKQNRPVTFQIYSYLIVYL